MSRESFFCIFLLLFIPTIIWGQEYPPQNDSKEQQINYRITETTLTRDQALFPFHTKSTGTGIWTELHPNIPRVGYWGVDFINADTGWAVGEAGAIIKTTNGGQDWELKYSNNDYWFYSICMLNNSTGWVGGGYVKAPGHTEDIILKTIDGGEIWSVVDVELNPWCMGVSFVFAFKETFKFSVLDCFGASG